jgi:hypothetical protein
LEEEELSLDCWTGVVIAGVDTEGGIIDCEFWTEDGFVEGTNGIVPEVVGCPVVAGTENGDIGAARVVGTGVSVRATGLSGVAIRHSWYRSPTMSQDSSVAMVTLGISFVLFGNDPAANDADSLQTYRVSLAPYWLIVFENWFSARAHSTKESYKYQLVTFSQYTPKVTAWRIKMLFALFSQKASDWG